MDVTFALNSTALGCMRLIYPNIATATAKRLGPYGSKLRPVAFGCVYPTLIATVPSFANYCHSATTTATIIIGIFGWYPP